MSCNVAHTSTGMKAIIEMDVSHAYAIAILTLKGTFFNGKRCNLRISPLLKQQLNNKESAYIQATTPTMAMLTKVKNAHIFSYRTPQSAKFSIDLKWVSIDKMERFPFWCCCNQ